MKDWVNKQTEIKTRRVALNEKERDYKTRLNNLQNSPAYRELLRKAPQSQECHEISAAAVQDFSKLDGDFEKAQRCLQGVCDGAR